MLKYYTNTRRKWESRQDRQPPCRLQTTSTSTCCFCSGNKGTGQETVLPGPRTSAPGGGEGGARRLVSSKIRKRKEIQKEAGGGKKGWRGGRQDWMENQEQGGERRGSIRICVCLCVCLRVAQSCPTLCNPMDCSPPGSSVLGILQATILEWAVVPFSRGSSQPRGQTHCIDQYRDQFPDHLLADSLPLSLQEAHAFRRISVSQ